MNKQKQAVRTQCFDKVLETCHRRIRKVASYGGMNTFFEVPGFIIGYPLFNIIECCGYVIDGLREDGFLVQVLPPPHVGVIYISWDPSEMKKKPPALTNETKNSSSRLRLF